MDYIKHYKSLIETRKLLNRSKNDGVYYEKHHIIPKSFGGTDKPANLILLTAKEHYIAHLLLHMARPHSKKLAYGLWCMCKMSNGIKINSGRIFEVVRNEALIKNNPSKKDINRKKSSERMSLNNPCSKENLIKTNRKHPNIGLNVSSLYGTKISDALIEYHKNNPNAFLGKTHSSESIEKISENSKQSKAVIIDGVTYNSLLKASKTLKIGYTKLRNQLFGITENNIGIKYVDDSNYELIKLSKNYKKMYKSQGR